MLFHHLKFYSVYVIGIACALSIMAGSSVIAYGFLIFLGFFIIGDVLFGDDHSTPEYRYPGLLTFALWLAMPMSLILMLSGLWLVSPSNNWPGIATMSLWLGIDLVAQKQQTTAVQLAVAAVFCGYILSSIGTISAHELVHRVGDKFSVTIGRWIMAMSFDANFSIEHVYGHHRYVATEQDPATAPRGRNVYTHIVISTIRGNVSAWHLEKQRLARKHQAVMSWHNRCLRGYAMSVVWLLLAYAIAGAAGVLFFVAAGLVCKAMLEIVNYMEHYGLVRDPKQRVMPKHSWNTNKRLSCWAMFNLTRHSHHHAQGAVRFEKLKPMPEAPEMVTGYMACVLLTLVPPLWYRVMQSKLEHWDTHYANQQELDIINRQNNESHSLNTPARSL
ncbi:alkane 1-monooxygenase [Alteromonas sp. ASW11-36]|uniref:Alkane 1-monooxygenase n=1 Tax=Alteromonas arenosi TaxID=3055817 RepID=A0ABT7SY21_9ALTE|nr:alkane 1-monooxygenase [Alteromonas sp. ASW11-36]MDM7861083.1 alkane 1-monooxygenase [Alteromonas sp. ASW11-36]